jgi:hypothetical protein
MCEIYMVDCCIDDGMKGENYILGIYDSFDLAKQEIFNFLEEGDSIVEYSFENGLYEVLAKNMHFQININAVKINETKIPRVLKK